MKGVRKTTRQILTTALAACLALALSVPALAAEAKAPAQTYKVRIYSGQRGLIDGAEVREMEVTAGERVNFYPGSVTLSDGKYYVKGIRESGKDNKEANASFAVDRDMDYVVAYGILGDSVAYTVNYLDGDGNALLPSETFYGNVGDQPVIAYRYIEGWIPQAYNLTGTLSENAAENVFDFVYSPAEGAQAYPGTGDGNEGNGTGADGGNTAAAGNGAADANAAGGANAADGTAGANAAGGAADGQVVADEQTPLDLQNIDDEETPLANIGDGIKNLVDPEGDGLLVNIPRPLLGVILAAIVFLFILTVVRMDRKKKGYRTDGK